MWTYLPIFNAKECSHKKEEEEEEEEPRKKWRWRWRKKRKDGKAWPQLNHNMSQAKHVLPFLQFNEPNMERLNLTKTSVRLSYKSFLLCKLMVLIALYIERGLCMWIEHIFFPFHVCWSYTFNKSICKKVGWAYECLLAPMDISMENRLHNIFKD